MTRLILLSIALLVLAGCSAPLAPTPTPLLPTSTAPLPTSTLPPSTPTAPPPTPTLPPTALPTATPTLAPTPTATFSPETPVGSIEDVVGTWLAPGGGATEILEFQQNGAYSIKLAGQSAPVDQGRYTVEGSQFHFLTSAYCSTHQEASYEVYVTKQAGISVRLRFVLVGDDLCAERKNSLAGETLPLAP